VDVAERLRQAINSLPVGEYTPGLEAVLRHATAAIRHFERADGHDEDAYTDCIYRTNQIYEGSLKEAYRIISKKEPTKISLYEIEEHFIKENTLRHRVLEQMSRYRHDYRNPSTHDYKLDFDENEALLAILSVTGFSILLIDQIRKALEQDALQAANVFQGDERLSDVENQVSVFSEELAKSIFYFLRSDFNNFDITSWETSALVSAFLEKSGLEITRDVYIESDRGWSEWDLIVQNESGVKLPIDIMTSRGRQSKDITMSRLVRMADFAKVSDYRHVILIEGTSNSENYELKKFTFLNPQNQDEITIFRIGNIENSPTTGVNLQ